jgi:hypothetical protein
VDPRLFDARMAELGRETSSYNLAAEGMNFPETFYVLEIALRHTPKLKLVVLETGSMQHRDNPIFVEGSLRALYWRDIAQTWSVVRSIWLSPGPPSREVAEKVGLVWHQLELLAENVGNLGRGAGMVNAWTGLKPPERAEVVPAAGYRPIHRRMSADDLQTFRERMKSKRPVLDMPLRDDPELRERFDRLVADLRARGVEPCFVYFPVFRKDQPVVPTATADRPVMALNFDHPGEYPELFAEENYGDTAHLNATGSALFTRKLAEAIHQNLKR